MSLFDKSGVNLKGKINTNNPTSFQDKPTYASINEKLSSNFYTTFWKAITYLQDPSIVQKYFKDLD
jgi:hypothetical protein